MAGDDRRTRSLTRGAIGGALSLLVVVAALWSQRRDLAGDIVARELARRGVPARYHLADVGFRTQRLTDVVIGDPARPDLVADRIDVETVVGLGGARVTGIRIGAARVRALFIDGRLSLGAVDKLMPARSGAPFALPAIDARLGDVRVRLETDYGVVGIRIAGAGRLNDGFDGSIAAFAGRLDGGGCQVARPRVVMRVKVANGAPTLTGPVAADDIFCPKDSPIIQAPGGEFRVVLNDRLDRWQGEASRFGAAVASVPGAGADKVYGVLRFAGEAARTTGDLDATTAGFVAPGVAGREGRVAGRFAVGRGGTQFAGMLTGKRVAIDRATDQRIAGYGATGAGTPIAPLVAQLVRAARAAGRQFDVTAEVQGSASAITVSRLSATAASGARAELGGDALRFGAVTLGGTLAIGGGGLPEVRAALRQLADGAIAGRAAMAPYRAGDARIALEAVDFRAAGGAITSVTTVATVSGPLGDGRVDDLVLPVAARWRGDTVAVNTGCAPLAWRRVAVAGLVLDPARLTLCPIGGALVTLANGRIGGGARIGAARLGGRLGGTPLKLAAAGAEVRLGETGFRLDGVATRLGAGDRPTRIDAASVTGRVAGGMVAGTFAGAGGQVGAVPLVMSGATGRWRLADGRLRLDGGVRVADAAAAPRFKPLVSDDVALTLANGRIDARGTLRTPGGTTRVADVTLTHVLASGAGSARLAVPGIVFAEQGLQPADLTPLTYGVIADVAGRVSGEGEIAWNRDGVTSRGRFGADRVDLAAAFGPVTGLTTEIVFTDLLGMVTAPGQVASVATINPGVPVENGTIRYRLLGPTRVAVEEGRWPLAAGALTLDATVLDFSADQQRRMTFRLAGIDAGQFLQQFDFKNLNATGTFDGVLPMVFDAKGGRIEDGRLRARGHGNIAYVGEVTKEDVGFWGNLAFQALRSLDYRDLEIVMNGPLAGEMVTELRFAGVSQGTGTRSNFLIRRLAKLPFVFNVTVRAPFRQLIDSVQNYYDPSRLIQRNLPALIEEQQRLQGTPAPIQPPESEKRP